jgi:hypothetical protein
MSLNDDIQATIMALRQGLMQYFKGSAVDDVVRVNSLQWSSHNPHTQHRYQAEQNRFVNRLTVHLGHHPLLTVEHEPDSICLHLGTLDRSKVMRKIKQGIVSARNSYLTSVILSTDTVGNPQDWKGDKTLVTRPKYPPINRGAEDKTAIYSYYIE